MNTKIIIISQAVGSLPCVNGDITIQCEWSNFDPSQKPNSVTDAQLITSTSGTRNPKFVPIGRKGAPSEKREI